MTVQPSYLSSEERNELQEIHGVCWNTDDFFEEDHPDCFEIQQYHRDNSDGGHWYLPFHETLKHEKFPTEVEAYAAASKTDKSLM